MYNNYIEPRGLIHDADFLTHDFMPTMLDALGLQDTSGVIFEIVEHDYFNITDLGNWDQMMPGMINVTLLTQCPKRILKKIANPFNKTFAE